MKKIVMAEEVSGEGLEALLGENVVVFCLNYIYSGMLTGVNTQDILLTDASIVYETGELCAKQLKSAQPLPNDLYIRTNCIECYYKRAY